MHRPVIFLSSTIYDFKDLRSSLKYFLEAQGCTVLASEYNDFSKPLDTHSYEACLNAIRNCDYYLLFIGSRVGGWFDEKNRISITQQEYREAYNLHVQGKLKIINFVRSDVWKLRGERSSLIKYIEELELKEEMKYKIINYPSKLASDADFVINFIDEVGRKNETRAAVSGGAGLPPGNWIHIFENFKDIIDVLHTHIFAGIPIEEVTLRHLLQRELTEYLRISLIKDRNSKIHSPIDAVELFHSKHNITKDIRDSEYISVTTKYWDYIVFASMQLLTVRYHPFILQQVLKSNIFLQYDKAKGIYKESEIYEALYQLSNEIRRLNDSNKNETLSVIFEYSRKGRGGYNPETLDIESVKLFGLLHLIDRWVNVIELSGAILRYLKGKPFKYPALRPRSPIKDMDIEFQNETPSYDDIEKFINLLE